MENAATTGKHLLELLEQVVSRHQGLVSNARGLGLMCAFDTRDGEDRKKILKACAERGLMLIGCGAHTIRFRPALTVLRTDIDEAIQLLDDSLSSM